MGLLFGLGYMALTLAALRGGLFGRGATTVVGFDTQSLGMGALAVAAAAWWFGPMYGLALVLSVAIHEFGHVAAYRVIGHHDARFRLVPLIGGYAISDQLPARQVQSFFVSLLGPGISVAPMVSAFALSDLMWPLSPVAAEFLWVFASVTAVMNLFNLLPFWPLDGGRCLRMIADTFLPSLASVITVGMSAACAALAVHMQSWGLVFFALMGMQSLAWADAVSRAQAPMTKGQGVLAAGAYVATAAAHLAGGYTLLSHYLPF